MAGLGQSSPPMSRGSGIEAAKPVLSVLDRRCSPQQQKGRRSDRLLPLLLSAARRAVRGAHASMLSWRHGLVTLFAVATLGLLLNICFPAVLSGGSPWASQQQMKGSDGPSWRALARLMSEEPLSEPLGLHPQKGQRQRQQLGRRAGAGNQHKRPAFQRAHLLLNISSLSCEDAVDVALDEGWEQGGAALRRAASREPTPTSAFKACAKPRLGDGVGPLRHVLTLRSGQPQPKLSVTLLSHLSLARLPMLENQCRRWPGPIAAAVYMPLVGGRMYLNETAVGNPWLEGNPWGSMEALALRINGSTVSEGMRLLSSFHQRMETEAARGAGAHCTLDLTFVVEERCNGYLAGLYPINAVRNRMILLARTDAVVLLDVDFVPSASLAEGLADSSSTSDSSSSSSSSHSTTGGSSADSAPAAGSSTSGGSSSVAKRLDYAWLQQQFDAKKAVVLPAFQTANRNAQLKTGIRQAMRAARDGKATVLEYLRNNTLAGFELAEYGRGHRATNYSRWRQATEPYEITYVQGYEPYLLMHRKHLPWYDERFRGYGWDKVIHTFHLHALGLRFVVHPTAFLVHVPHPRAITQAITADTGQREVLHKRFVAAKRAIAQQRYRPTASLPEVCA